jgi:DNA/RNA-binding domain of Phe-tRNA-synthetase-like protein
VSAFQYHPEVLKRYPAVVGGIILADGMTNGPTNGPTAPALAEKFLAEQKAALARIGATPLSELPQLAAWRSALRGFGVDPTAYRVAPEALLRRLTKKGDIPSINTLVDIGNLVSIRYALAVAVFDTRAVTQPITVKFADGPERFTPLFETEVEHPEPGEVVFSDETGLLGARRWCWRQADQSAARDDTTRAIVTIEGHHAGAREDVDQAMADLLALMGEYVGGEFTTAVLDKDHPSTSG